MGIYPQGINYIVSRGIVYDDRVTFTEYGRRMIILDPLDWRKDGLLNLLTLTFLDRDLKRIDCAQISAFTQEHGSDAYDSSVSARLAVASVLFLADTYSQYPEMMYLEAAQLADQIVAILNYYYYRDYKPLDTSFSDDPVLAFLQALRTAAEQDYPELFTYIICGLDSVLGDERYEEVLSELGYSVE